MGTDKVKVILETIIDEAKAKAQINKLIKQIQSKSKIKLDVDSSSVTKSVSELSRITKANTMQTWADGNSKAMKKWGNEVNDLISKFKDLDKPMKLTESQELLAKFESIRLSAKQAGDLGATSAEKLNKAWEKSGGRSLANSALSSALSTVKNMWNEVVTLDTALVDLKKTTDASAQQIKDFYFSSNDTAKQLGVTTAEVINATAAWSRLGYGMKDAAALAESSTILSSLSPDINITEATDGLVSALDAFKIKAADSLDGIISKINIVGNTRAVDNGDLVDILTTSSSAMAAANNTLEQTIALGTAAAEITKDAASTGAALNTIAMRLQSLNEETGLFDETLSGIKGAIHDLTGVSVMQDADTYKSTYEILKEISKVWDSLTDKAKAQTLDGLFGKGQANVGAAILSNFSAAEDSMNSMADSTGNAMEEMNVIFDSTEYKLNRLKETGTGIAQNLFDSESMKVSIDILNKFAEAVDFLTEQLGLLGTAGVIGGGILGAKGLGGALLFKVV